MERKTPVALAEERTSSASIPARVSDTSTLVAKKAGFESTNATSPDMSRSVHALSFPNDSRQMASTLQQQLEVCWRHRGQCPSLF